MSIKLDSIVSVTDAQVSTSLGDNVVILSLNDGTYYGLNEVGQDIWSMLDKPIEVQAVCANIASLYDVDPAVCQSDVVNLLTQLEQHSLVVSISRDAT